MSTIFELGDDSSDSENDGDYVPSEEDASELSLGENTDDDVPLDDGASSKGKKRKKKGKKANVSVNNEDNDCNENQNGVCEEDEKKRAESLWQDFLQDVTPAVRKKHDINATKSPVEVSDKSVRETSAGAPPKVTVSEVFEFAGEAVVVTKEVDQNSKEAKEVAPGKTLSVSSVEKSPSKEDVQNSGKNSTTKRPSGGLGSVLGTIMNKKQKLSTLQKSMLDWKSFKKDEGIEEELDQHRRSKNSYVEKQAFLQRSDLRQFEIEKSIRMSNSKVKR